MLFHHLNRSLLLLFLLIGQVSLLFSQSANATEQGDQYYLQAKLAFRNRQVDSFILYMDVALQYYRKDENWNQVFSCYQGLSNFYRRQGDFARSLIYADSLIMLTRGKIEDEEDRYDGLGHAYLLKGVLNNELGYLEEAIANYRRAIVEKEKMEKVDSQALAKSWNNLAIAHSDLGDYEQALKCYQRAFAFLPIDGGWEGKATIWNNIGHIYFLLDQPDSAIPYFLRAYRLFQTDPEGAISSSLQYAGNYINFCNNLGKAYLKRKQYDSSYLYLAEALRLEQPSQNDDKLSLSYQLLGKLRVDQGLYQEGLDLLNKSLLKAVAFYQSPHPRIGVCHLEIGRAHLERAQWEKARTHLTQAWENLLKNSAQVDSLGFPDLIDHVFSKIDMLKVAHAFGELGLQQYHGTGKDHFLREALRYFHFADDLIVSMRQSYLGEESKHYLAERSDRIYGEAIEAALAYYRSSGDRAALAEAFFFMERNRASSLMESRMDKEARMFSNIRASEKGQLLLSEESRLKRELAAYRRLLFESESKPDAGRSQRISHLQGQIFEKDRRFDEIRTELEKSFPDYYQLKYSSQVVTLEEVRQRLGDGQLLLEYHFAPQRLWALALTADAEWVEEIPMGGPEKETIREFIEEAHGSSFDLDPFLSFEQFVSSASKSYDLLLRKILAERADKTEQILIVPDGMLHFLPFAALLTDRPSDSVPDYSGRHLAYLVESYEIGYLYSATSWSLPRKKPRESTRRRSFAGFAPRFAGATSSGDRSRNCEGMALAPLAGNKQEVLDIAGLLGGDYFLDGQADRESFERSARQYQIVHLATHACVNSADPLYNQIFFSDDQYLYTFDIYNLNLNADLIVLSACETGLGKVVEGEGVMNLARGFAYAGCPSIVMSLWAVSDQASSTLMLEYYRRLLEGESKTAALQQAQLSYLQNQIPSKMHPSYWAPFVQVGDPSAMRWDSKKNGWSWYWVLAALPLLWLAWRQTRKSGLRSV